MFLFSPIKIGPFDFEKKCEELAQRTDGFSGREIAKLLAACQVSFYYFNNRLFISIFFYFSRHLLMRQKMEHYERK